MNISTTNIESVAVVRLEGNLDTNTSTDAQESLNQLIDGGASKVLVNFADVDFVSSAGLRILSCDGKEAQWYWRKPAYLESERDRGRSLRDLGFQHDPRRLRLRGGGPSGLLVPLQLSDLSSFKSRSPA